MFLLYLAIGVFCAPAPVPASDLKPFVIQPGLYGSNLYATYNDFAKHWYCPKKYSDEIIWVDATLIIPPLYNCLFEMLTCQWNETSKRIESAPNIDVHAHDFGGVDGISKVAELGIIKLIESFGNLVQYMKDRGYVVRKNFFGVPYDWRLGVAGLNESNFFTTYRELIESAYELNNQKKVVLLGYSLGAFCLSHFLGRLQSDAWKAKYIDKIVMMAPAFAGAGETLPVAWDRNFPIVPFLKNDIIANCIEHMPVVHTLFPNHVVFEGKPVIITPEGNNILAHELPQFYIDQGKISGSAIPLLEASVHYSKLAPADPKVDTMLLYNSQLSTNFALNFKNGYNKDPVVETVGGDGTVPSAGPEWACENWNKDRKFNLFCYDLNKNDDDFDHMGIGNNAYVNEILFNFTNTNQFFSFHDARNVKPRGQNLRIKAPFVKLTNTTECGYIVEGVGQVEVVPQ